MSYRLVLVDDNPEDIYVIKRILNRNSNLFQVIEFVDADEAIEFICHNPPDCILIDYNLANMTAMDFADKYKAKSGYIVPMIIMTGQGDEGLAVNALKHGVSDYLVKRDINNEMLVKSIQYAVDMKSSKDKESENQEFLKILVNNIPEPLYYKDHLLRYIGCNKAFEELTGLKMADILNETDEAVFPKEWADIYAKKDKQLLANPGVQTYESKFLHRDGSERFVVNKIATYNNSRGEVAGIIGTIHDITTSKLNENLLYEKSYYDFLTGIHNRRYFDEKVASDWTICMRVKKPISLLMLDIDFFKNYNDKYGHLMGDQCLKAIANAIKLALKRPADFVARYGGEEFAIILPFTDIQGAVHMAELIQDTIRTLTCPTVPEGSGDRLTLSLGIATCNGEEDSINDLINRADKALYAAKSLGRDRYEIG